ncbi:VanZ family protein [Eubacterium oxidoreducens]|uniref:Glycopeptide antibiotics resistance protein n=1 Tax=Eubacterium oxidoreducens TaxID=1732 RepID=A0A1G6BCU6_EUBOX|nr:VanZ family protein [Eubacterium oxidoreducens]SDB18438.1 Glycopeptide antibiotics resistance protein [Eubacterium oxidoreducens]
MSRRKKRSLQKVVCSLLFLTYLIVLFYFLFFAESFGRNFASEEYQYNLTLFKEIMLYWNYREQIGYGAVFINLIGNIGAFVPFGFLVPSMFPKKNVFFPKVLLEGFLFSLIVESIQLFTKVGSFDVDDILLNTIGVVIGYIIFAIVRHIGDRTYKKYLGRVKNGGKTKTAS